MCSNVFSPGKRTEESFTHHENAPQGVSTESSWGSETGSECRVCEALAGIKRQGFVRYERRLQPAERSRPVNSCLLDVAWLVMVSRQHDEALVSSRKVSDVSLVVRRSSGRTSFGSSGCRFGQPRDPTISRSSSPMGSPNVRKPPWLRTPVSADGGLWFRPINWQAELLRPSWVPRVRDPTATKTRRQSVDPSTTSAENTQTPNGGERK